MEKETETSLDIRLQNTGSVFGGEVFGEIPSVKFRNGELDEVAVRIRAVGATLRTAKDGRDRGDGGE